MLRRARRSATSPASRLSVRSRNRPGGRRRRARAQGQPGVEAGRETIARGSGDGCGRRLGERRVDERRAHAGPRQDRRLVVLEPELALQALACVFDLGNEVVAVAVVALPEPREIGRQIDLEHGGAEPAQPLCGPLEIGVPARLVREQEDQPLGLTLGRITGRLPSRPASIWRSAGTPATGAVKNRINARASTVRPMAFPSTAVGIGRNLARSLRVPRAGAGSRAGKARPVDREGRPREERPGEDGLC